MTGDVREIIARKAVPCLSRPGVRPQVCTFLWFTKPDHIIFYLRGDSALFTCAGGEDDTRIIAKTKSLSSFWCHGDINIPAT